MSQLRRFASVLFAIILVSALLVGVSLSALADQDSDGGSYDVLIFKNGDWQLQGKLSFSDYETRRLPLGNGAGQLRVRLTQHGHDGAFVDYLALERETATFAPASAINVGSSASVLTKVMSPEYDVCDAWDSTLEVVWENVPDNVTLVMRAMEEDFGEGHGVPLYYPRIQQGESLSYTLVDNGSICVDGWLQESTEPHFTIFWQPDSPHPDGYTYGWLHSDTNFLYAAVEVTADNTLDEEDWGALYLVVNGAMREFRVTDDEEQWGVSGFQYTSSVAYEHRVYEFQIPLNEISANIGAQIRYGFGCYGTVAVEPPPTKHSSTCGMDWGIVNTPSWDDGVILPSSDIIDYAIGGDEGDIIYAVLELSSGCVEVGHYFDAGDTPLNAWGNFALVKSDDGGVTWSDITDNVIDASSLPVFIVEPTAATDVSLNLVSVAPDDEGWLAVAGYYDDGVSIAPVPFVVASQDGGSNFTYAHPVEDSTWGTQMIYTMDMAVSPKVGSIHNIALAGVATTTVALGVGAVFRLEAGTWLTGGWEDTRFYPGWDDSSDAVATLFDWDPNVVSGNVVAVDFSPNFDMDDTIVCMSFSNGIRPYVQEGTLDGDGAWNAEAGFNNAVQITDEGATLVSMFWGWRTMGFALPDDFDGSEPADNNIYLYVNAIDFPMLSDYKGYVMIFEDGALSARCGPSGDPLLASIDVYGDADTCKAMVGVYLDYEWGPDGGIMPTPCAGVAVYHTVELDDCCPEWESACKDPSGPFMAVVSYTADGKKAFASTTGSWSNFFGNNHLMPTSWSWTPSGNPLDESAFSVSLDDAVSFNQIGLIDTDIDYLSDVAVCPDCSVIYLSTVNEAVGRWGDDDIPYGDYPCLNTNGEPESWFACDSIWRSYDNGDTWERVFHGDWMGYEDYGWPLLRLPCDTDEDCCTVYLGLAGKDQMFYSRDCGQCWNEPPTTKINIRDFAVESDNIVYLINNEGEFSMSTQYGRRWSDPVDTGIDSGHTISACCNEDLIVVAGYGDEAVAYSSDGGETWEQTAELPGSGTAHIACDPICEGTIYAALSEPVGVCGGIYRWVIGDSTEWTNMNAFKYGYYGIAVGRSDGTLYAVTDTIFIDPDEEICDRFVSPYDEVDGDFHNYEVYSGVARNLDPCETDCCGTEDWDYLICGLGTQCAGSKNPGFSCIPTEWFENEPSGLRICGCLSSDTNSILWAIDAEWYDVTDGSGDNDHYGSLWSYEDCAAKHGPELTSPEEGAVLACDVCETCEGAPMTLKWERMCCACSYDIEIMDEDGNIIWDEIDVEITGDPPEYYLDDSRIECGSTYMWHVREANTDCECVHSPWSETWSFTIEASSANALRLISPENGDMLTNRSGVGFSWTSVADATSYSFVLSENPDLSSALATSDQSGTAYAYSGTLDYETTYYWQVTAWKNGTMLSQSDIATFSIAPEEVIPPTPEPTPPPEINIPPTQQIVPTWIYAVIGIGAALIVVVIVLIVRTRRP